MKLNSSESLVAEENGKKRRAHLKTETFQKLIQQPRTSNEPLSIVNKQMAAIKQVLLGVVIMTVLLGEENTISRLVKAQNSTPLLLSEHACANYINLTQFSELCNLSNINYGRLDISWYKSNYTTYRSMHNYIQNALSEPCPLDPCYPCRNDSDSDTQLMRVLNITYCYPHYLYQLPVFRCIFRYRIEYFDYRNTKFNTGPLYINCSNSSIEGKYK